MTRLKLVGDTRSNRETRQIREPGRGKLPDAFRLAIPLSRVSYISRFNVSGLTSAATLQISQERQRRLGTYDRLVAALAGALKDSPGKGPRGVQAEIFNDARFERLEAEGRAEFGAKIEEARRIIQSQALGGEQSCRN